MGFLLLHLGQVPTDLEFANLFLSCSRASGHGDILYVKHLTAPLCPRGQTHPGSAYTGIQPSQPPMGQQGLGPGPIAALSSGALDLPWSQENRAVTTAGEAHSAVDNRIPAFFAARANTLT